MYHRLRVQLLVVVAVVTVNGVCVYACVCVCARICCANVSFLSASLWLRSQGKPTLGTA